MYSNHVVIVSQLQRSEIWNVAPLELTQPTFRVYKYSAPLALKTDHNTVNIGSELRTGFSHSTCEIISA